MKNDNDNSRVILNELFCSLSKRSSSGTVFNQYSNPDILENMRLYFRYLESSHSGVLMTGEAPGHRGCRWTGIPFTSCYVIKNCKHRMFKAIAGDVILEGDTSENTAKIFWDVLKDDTPVPILWNAFPFHPHKEGNPKSNRKPNSEEMEEGRSYLKMMHRVFKPSILCGVGRVGESVLKDLFPGEKIVYIRHPSFGGKPDFVSGIQQHIFAK